MLVELHCHSRHSDGIPGVKEIIRKADRELGAIAITDHNRQDGYFEAKAMKKNVLLVPGVEITCSHGQRTGHVLALGVEEFRQGDVFDVIDFVRSSGGVTVIAHPFRGLGYSFSQRDVWRKADAIEVLNGSTLAYKNMRAYRQAREMKKSMTSGSDAHWLKFVGKYACRIEADSVDGILKCIRKGRVEIPRKSTSALSILMRGAVRKSRRRLGKIIGKGPYAKVAGIRDKKA